MYDKKILILAFAIFAIFRDWNFENDFREVIYHQILVANANIC